MVHSYKGHCNLRVDLLKRRYKMSKNKGINLLQQVSVVYRNIHELALSYTKQSYNTSEMQTFLATFMAICKEEAFELPEIVDELSPDSMSMVKQLTSAYILIISSNLASLNERTELEEKLMNALNNLYNANKNGLNSNQLDLLQPPSSPSSQLESSPERSEGDGCSD